jgi:hypothetical protein
MYEEIGLIIAGLTGLGGFISILVNLLKQFGVVQEGDSDKWFKGLNVATFIAVSIVYYANFQFNWLMLDDWLTVLASLLGLIAQLVGGQVAYKVLRGAPVVGYSFTLAQGESPVDEILFDFELYRELAETIVRSIEQSPAYSEYTSGEKKQRAMMELSTWFDSQQIEVSVEIIDMLIEAAVQVMNG